MKSLWGKLGVIFIGLAIFSCAEVWGADWVFYGNTDKYSCCYDVKSINHPSQNIVEVLEKEDYTNNGVNFMVESLGKKYENLSHTMTLWEISCVEKNFRFLSITHYSKENSPIYSWKLLYSSKSPTEWTSFTPGSLGEKLYKAVCK